ncbi:MAG TPA: amidohydrolase family protein [bacterium]|nr:amidohydrolase family protein [bacterium]
MAVSGFTVIDTDAHYLESFQEVAKYMEEPYKSRLLKSAHRLIPTTTGDRFLEGRIRRDEVSYPQKPMTPDEIPAAQKRLGVDVSVILPNNLLELGKFPIKNMALALCQGFNDYMLDQIVDPKRGIYTMVFVPLLDPPESAKLIDRVGKHPGVSAVCFISANVEPPLGDTFYNPVYEAAQRNGLPIVYHSAGSDLHDFFVRGFQTFAETHSLGFVFWNYIHMTSVVMEGIPERFPGIKFAFQESGIFWVPQLMYRLDNAYMKRRSESPLLKKLPSEYIREFRFGTQPLESPKNMDHLKYAFEMVDAENTLMFSTDYPHWDFDPPSTITDLPFLSHKAKTRILSENAENFFRF